MIVSSLYADYLFGKSRIANSRKDLTKDCKLLILSGGEDISPGIYNEKVGRARASPSPSARDCLEIDLARRARELNIPILGICRGAQLICALDGGKLWQHVDNHGNGDHVILTVEGQELESNSCHHQMMIPRAENCILASCPKTLSPYKWRQSEETENHDPDPEIVHFPEWKCIGVQGHPEWLSTTHPLVRLVTHYVEKFLWSF